MINKEAIANPPAPIETPFRHFQWSEVISLSGQESLLKWFETSAPWEPHIENGFYDVHDFNVHKAELSNDVEFIRSKETTDFLRHLVSRVFSVELAERVDMQAHRLREKQLIKVHTDFGPVGQSHRLVIQINRGWRYEWGGILVLLDCERPSDINPKQKYFIPKSGCAVGFEISPTSFHAVSPVISGERYTLQYSFRKKKKERNV